MKRVAVCPVCGAVFTATRVSQKYCGAFCRRYAYRYGLNGCDHDADAPVLSSFHCVKCGRLVNVTSPNDKRTKFCSARCERQYWKYSKRVHPKRVSRTFRCKTCGRLVVVTEAKDKRTKFCGETCRKRWYSLHRRKTHKGTI